MVRAFGSEWIKIRRLSVLAAGASMSFFAGLGVYFGIVRATSPSRLPEAFTRAALESDRGLTTVLARGAQLVEVVALILVTAAMAAEYSQGTLRNLLVREPGRLRLLAGKFIAMLLYTLIAATIAVAVGTAVGLLSAPIRGVDTSAWTSSAGVNNLVDLYGNLLLSTTAWAILGLFSALVFRSAAAAVGISLAYGLVVEGLLGELWQDAPRWLYGRLAGAVLNGGNDVSGYGRSLALVGAYAAAMLAIGGFLFRRRDITS